MKNFKTKCGDLFKSLIFSIFIFGIIVAPLFSQDLSSVNAYLNSIRSIKSDFRQINSDGSISTGKIWLKKPGKLRFEYHNPESLLVLANSGFLVVIDKISNTAPQRYFTKQTPLSFLVDDNLSLTEKDFKLSLNENGKLANLSITKFDSTDGNTFVLHFNLKPLSVRGWTLATTSGETIKIDLFQPEFNISIEDDLIFGIGGEIQKHIKAISE